MAQMQIVQNYVDHGHGAPADQIELTYQARFLRRRVLVTRSGAEVLVDLEQTTSLDHGGRLVTGSGAEIEVIAAQEQLLEITAPNLTPIAWHIGNRHTPCQIEEERLLIEPDHVMAALMERLGATVREVTEPFTPEGGAYGYGRTHGHDHSHQHGADHGH